MATTRIWLAPGDATLPSANPATLATVTSSATATTNTPKPTFKHLVFDQSTDQHAMWSLPVLDDYLSGPTVKVFWGAAPTSGNVIWLAGLMAGVASSTDLDASTFLAADAASAVAVPSTSEQFKTTSIACTATGVAAGGFISVFVGRDADAGGDTAAGDAYLVGAVLSYTS